MVQVGDVHREEGGVARQDEVHLALHNHTAARTDFLEGGGQAAARAHSGYAGAVVGGHQQQPVARLGRRLVATGEAHTPQARAAEGATAQGRRHIRHDRHLRQQRQRAVGAEAHAREELASEEQPLVRKAALLSGHGRRGGGLVEHVVGEQPQQPHGGLRPAVRRH